MANQDAPFGFRAVGGMDQAMKHKVRQSIKSMTIQRQRFIKVTFAWWGITIPQQPMQMVTQYK